MNSLKLIVMVALTSFGLHAGCGGVDSPEGLGKQEARRIGKADWTVDHCAENGWYGDGHCDDFCPLRDPDCPREACRTDEGCQYGFSWCEDGACVPCDNSGMFCELACPWGFEERNGCTPCRCARSNGCQDDSDCRPGEEWCIDGACRPCDNSGMFCDLYCEFGYLERNGCTPCQCAEPAPECMQDADCRSGAEWCVDWQCVACDNSGQTCELHCPNGFVERNGCTPCQCAPREGGCQGDQDCQYGEEWCTNGECTQCDNSGLLCYLHCHNGFIERNGCTPCICAP